MSAPPLTNAKIPRRARGRDPERVGELQGREPAQPARRHDRTEHAARRRGMKAALAQVGMTGAADGDLGLVARDDRLDQRGAGDAPVVAEREHRRHHHAARMQRALAEAVVELDAVGGSTAQERRVDEVGAAGAARHRNAAGRPDGGKHRLGPARDLAAGTGDHHTDGVEEMPPRVVAHLVGQLSEAQPADESDDSIGRSGGGMQRLQGFGVGHGRFLGRRTFVRES
jgi:hypothetical protein